MIRRIAYASIPRPDLARIELPRVIASARNNNELNGIGGVLVYTGADFLHVIEGPPPAVALLWERIRRDHRHRAIGKFHDDVAAEAWYPEFRVGYLRDDESIRRIAAWRELCIAPEEMLAQHLQAVLRQSDPGTTSGYAKVDRIALRAVAQSWPGVAR